MTVIEQLFLIALFAVAIAALVVIVEPKGTADEDLRAFNRVWLNIALFGVLGAIGGSFFLLRDGHDGGWWPAVAVIYSSAWVVLVAVSGAVVRWRRVRRASIVRSRGHSSHG